MASQTASPFRRGSPGRRGFPAAGSPFAPPPRALPLCPGGTQGARRSFGSASFGTEAPRCPARRRSPATAASPAPSTGHPGSSGPQRCGSGIPSLPGSPRSSLSARRARSLRRANRAQHAEPSGVRGAVARAPPIAAQPEPALQPPAHGRPDHVCQGTRLPHPALGGGAAPARPARALRAGGG